MAQQMEAEIGKIREEMSALEREHRGVAEALLTAIQSSNHIRRRMAEMDWPCMTE